MKLYLAALLALGTLFVGLPAGAATRNGMCEGTEVCVWRDAGKTGGTLEWQVDDLHYSNDNYWNTANSVHDSVSAVRNRGQSCNVRMYVDDNQLGSSFLLYRPSTGLSPYEDTDLSTAPGPYGFNDQLDSHRWTGGSCP